ncbi:uncharacterized protein A1O9_08822 [Exophiala aquamarina CBS 119918]|uniref:Xylanolytic transcriptional activator regulatory domain-containing protein n=1 Tax=Exophiala aquamarina CBS 119918 TaxID=1182545 RepID=A0A072P7B4_9EURO|nr:uncharacterized protein A1O9_08822 [Exophiala aquamarina CBS 119918]KEF55168.1 hypothetical protein A1O9_08822 [Exophiala aquamarina CBS 119918]
MVKELMQSQPSAQRPHAEPSPKPITPPALLQDVTNIDSQAKADHLAYVGSTHWSAILDDIQELKAVLGKSVENQEDDDSAVPETRDLGSEVIFGSPMGFSMQQIISRYLPPKIEVDRLVSLYFQGKTFIAPFIHTHQFQRQYSEFWADTSKVHPLWLSMLFSICYTASIIKERVRSFHASQNESSVGDHALHIAAGQCLVLGEYNRPQQLGLEALGMYANSKNLRSLDPCREAGALLGMVVRMAYEMGYHRDPDSFGSFTVFEGEMRRRLWASVVQMDLMMSFMLGLPSNIYLETCDTKAPRNLLDSDFDVDTKVLPEARSEQEATRLLWFIVKVRQMPNFSKASRDALSFTENSEAEILALDQDIRQMYTTIPDVLRTRPLSESLADEPFLIMTRVYVEFIYLKSICVLHRRYMVRGDAFSTRSCVEAGKQIVSNFIEMYREFSPGGQLCTERWMLSNFTVNDVLLGVMVLCLVLHRRRKFEGQADPTFQYTIDEAIEHEIFELLGQAHAILAEKSQASRDVRRVSHAVQLTLRGFKSSSKLSFRTHEPSTVQDSQLTMSEPAAHVAQDIPLETMVDSVNRVSLASFPLQGQQSRASQPPTTPLRTDRNSYSMLPFEALDPFNFMTDVDSIDWSQFDPDIEAFDQPYDTRNMMGYMAP